MGILARILQMLGGNSGMSGMGNTGNMGSTIDVAMQLINSHGGVQGLLQKLQQGGLGQQVASWTGTGANQPVNASQISSALGSDTLNQLASKFGLNTSALSGGLASVLPNLIDKVTPNGAVDGNTQQLLGEGKDKLMSILTGMGK